ncbi:carbohydrate-binding domain-containing protein [Faecalibacterium prausnitzii]|nr:carbohydrate-binding domain-containing protein [Faecalibacterium prausnitzii]
MLSYRKLAMRVLGRPLHTGGGIDSPRPASQRAAAFILTAAMLTTLAAPAFADTWCIENGNITVKAGDTKGTNKVSQGSIIDKVDTNTVITNNNKNTASSNTVTIEAKDKDDKVEVKLDNVNIDTSKQNKAAVSVTGSGDTTIELDGDNKLKSGSAHAGLEHNKTDTSGELTIQDNNKDGGSLKATGGQFGAGIGGAGVNDAQVKITGGKITATGGEFGAGIGGGFKGSGDVTITGGEIHANGGSYSAGIGGGEYSSGKVTISGGEITATGSYLGAGIGGGEKGSGDVTITGGEITANGGSYGAGIGGGKGVYLASDKKIHGGDGKVTITGGKITATSKSFGAGIGGGSNGSGDVTIEGNTEVNAAGGTGGAGIGSGAGDAKANITLEGKVTIVAKAGDGNVAIGDINGEQELNGLAPGSNVTRSDSEGNDISLPGDKVPTPSGGDTAGGGSTDGDSAGGGSAGGDSAGGGSTGGGSTGGDSTGGDSADVSVQESVFPGLVVTGKDGQRTSYTSIRGNNILSLRVGRFTASFRISLSTLRQLRAEGIDTITFQTILCSTTLSVDELLAMGGEDTPVALAHSMGTARLTVGGEDHSELLK